MLMGFEHDAVQPAERKPNLLLEGTVMPSEIEVE